MGRGFAVEVETGSFNKDICNVITFNKNSIHTGIPALCLPIFSVLKIINPPKILIVKLVNLRNRTGEERRLQTLRDKRDNNFVSNNFSPNFTFF